jgi:enoyl-CoA hydratase
VPDLVTSSKTQPHVVTVTLNRPEKLNAFNIDLREGLASALRSAEQDESVRVVVLRGAGRAFSVGADVGGARSTKKTVKSEAYGHARTAAEDFVSLADRATDTFLSVWNSPLPVVAQVHGYCMGIATVLVQCCDLVYCAEDTVFGWPAVPMGGGMIGPVWAHAIGPQIAKEMSFTVGARLSGLEAARLGVVNRALPETELEGFVAATTGHMARLSRDLLRIKKAAINQVESRKGFEETIRLGPAWDAIAHETDIVRESFRRIDSEGLKNVISDWVPVAGGLR